MRRAKHFIVLLVALLALAFAVPAGASTIGPTTQGASTDNNLAGRSQNYALVLSGPSGSINRLNTWLDSTNSASQVKLGLYSGTSSSAGARIATCTVTLPVSGLNSCTVPTTQVTNGAYYWTAILQPTGTSGSLVYRDTINTNASYGSSSTTLASLPATWTNGPLWNGHTASIFADLASTPAAPTAAFTSAPAAPVTGQPVSFDASTTSCPATPCTYSWRDDGPDGPAAPNYPLGTGQTLSFTFNDPGTKYVRLTATDSLARTSDAMHNVVVGADHPAVAVWTPPVGVTTGNPVTLTGTASTGDGALTCEWSFENADSSVIYETADGCTITKTFSVADMKYVRLTVTDADGDSNENLKTFSVTDPAPSPTPTPTPTGTPVDHPAVATWDAPSGAIIGTPVSLDGSASTGDSPLTCLWGFENSDATTVYETAPGCSITKTFSNPDTKYVRLTVTDADGDTANTLKAFDVGPSPTPTPTPTPSTTPTPTPTPTATPTATPTPPPGCTSTITGGSLSSAMAALPSGGTVCLNAGNYTWSGTVTQTALTTARAATGVSRSAVVVTNGLDLGQSVNLAFSGMTVRGAKIVQRTTAQHLRLDNIDFPNVTGGYGGLEGRLSIQGPGPATYGGADTIISGSYFHGPGSDGIQLSGQAAGLDISGNEFTDILQSGCGSVHCDAIQTYGANHNRFDSNWMHGTSTGFANFDCNSDPQRWTNNVVDARQGTEPSLAFDITGSGPDVAQHNTVLGATITIGSSNCQTNENVDIRDNVLGGAPTIYPGDNWASGANDHNQYGTPTMVGGTNPSTRAGYALAPSSPGYHNGSDGQSIGITG